MKLRILAVVMMLAAIAWGYYVWRQAAAMDDGGPAIGAAVMALPGIVLFILAGVVWQNAGPPRR